MDFYWPGDYYAKEKKSGSSPQIGNVYMSSLHSHCTQCMHYHGAITKEGNYPDSEESKDDFLTMPLL